MKSHIKVFGLSLAIAAIAATGSAATDPAASTNAPDAGGTKAAMSIDDLLPDPVIVRGKGFEIKRSKLDEVMTTLKAGAIASGQTIQPAQIPQLEQQLLDNLIETRLLLLQATDAQKAKGKEDAQTRFDTIRKKAPSERELMLQLRARGFTPEKLQADLQDEATAQAVMMAKVPVSDADVKKFYDDNPSKFEQKEIADVEHILIGTKDSTGVDLPSDEREAKLKLAESILKRARDGEDFAKLASLYSDDPNTKDTGGEVKISRGGAVPPEFEAAAFSLKTNQISDVVQTVYGYHIIKLLARIPAHRLELKDVSADVKAYLQQQQAQKLLPTMYAQMKKDANVEILDPDLNQLEKEAEKKAAQPPASDTP
jgi:parvulin-like peptidyl-prolyl isomerase